MRKKLQHALTQESGVRHDRLQQALRHQVCQEEYADAAAHQELEQLKQLISQQAEATKRFESRSQQYVTQQHEEWHHTHRPQFQGVVRDKDELAHPAFETGAGKQPGTTPERARPGSSGC